MTESSANLVRSFERIEADLTRRLADVWTLLRKQTLQKNGWV
jgi:hypothetical protein